MIVPWAPIFWCYNQYFYSLSPTFFKVLGSRGAQYFVWGGGQHLRSPIMGHLNQLVFHGFFFEELSKLDGEKFSKFMSGLSRSLVTCFGRSRLWEGHMVDWLGCLEHEVIFHMLSGNSSLETIREYKPWLQGTVIYQPKVHDVHGSCQNRGFCSHFSNVMCIAYMFHHVSCRIIATVRPVPTLAAKPRFIQPGFGFALTDVAGPSGIY